jgi:hypothetical protein
MWKREAPAAREAAVPDSRNLRREILSGDAMIASSDG